MAVQHCKGPKARFLCLYSEFLASERNLQQCETPFAARKTFAPEPNPKLTEILRKLQDVQDPFLLFLKGIVLNKLGRRLEAISQLVQSAVVYPYNWSCWIKIAQLIERTEELTAVDELIPDTSFMSRIFGVHAVLELHSASEALEDRNADLLAVFPNSLFLQSQRASIQYNLREFHIAEEIYEQVAEADPLRLEDLDTYSNILYVMEKKAKLSQLAQRYSQVDKNRPEICCLVGNYYSIRSDHVRAISYFQRALKLDSGYLSAWTLMGHEYLELKNTHAAVEAYRRAIDINKKDFRAWFGLGQTYEIMEMPYYSSTYFQRATGLRPYDGRMWQALAGAYEKLDKRSEALKAYKRALCCPEPFDTSIYERITAICESMGRTDLAKQYQRAAIEGAISAEWDFIDYAPQVLKLASLEMSSRDAHGRANGDLDLAERYLTKLANACPQGEIKDRSKEVISKLSEIKLQSVLDAHT